VKDAGQLVWILLLGVATFVGAIWFLSKPVAPPDPEPMAPGVEVLAVAPRPEPEADVVVAPQPVPPPRPAPPTKVLADVPVRTLKPTDNDLQYFVLDEEGQNVVVVSPQASRCWDINRKQELHRFTTVLDSSGTYLAPNGKIYVQLKPDQPDTLTVRATATGQVLATYRGPKFQRTSCSFRPTFTPDSRHFVFCTRQANDQFYESFRIVNLATGQARVTPGVPSLGHPQQNLEHELLAANHDGSQVFAYFANTLGGTAPARVCRIDTANGQVTGYPQLTVYPSHRNNVPNDQFKLSRDSRVLGMKDGSWGEVQVVDARTGRSLLTVPADRIPTPDFALTPDGQRLIVVKRWHGHQHTLRLYEFGQGDKPIAETTTEALGLPTGQEVVKMDLTRDARTIALLTKTHVTLVDFETVFGVARTPTPAPLTPTPTEPPTLARRPGMIVAPTGAMADERDSSVASFTYAGLSSDGGQVVTVSQKELICWSADGRVRYRRALLDPHTEQVFAAPDAQTFVVLDWAKKAVRVHHAHSGQLIGQYPQPLLSANYGHFSAVPAFTADGREFLWLDLVDQANAMFNLHVLSTRTGLGRALALKAQLPKPREQWISALLPVPGGQRVVLQTAQFQRNASGAVEFTLATRQFQPLKNWAVTNDLPTFDHQRLSFSPDGATVRALAFKDRLAGHQLGSWPPGSGGVFLEPSGPYRYNNPPVFTPDGQRAITIDHWNRRYYTINRSESYYPDVIRLLEVRTGRVLAGIRQSTLEDSSRDLANHILVSGDGTTLALVRARDVQVLNMAKFFEIAPLPPVPRAANYLP
jgi:hypothetical protein